MYSIDVDATELELTCPCGYENFERIVVERKPRPPIVTDFVACVGCKTMYWAPLRQLDVEPPRPGHEMRGIEGPERTAPDSSAALKRDASEAAQDYRKPGRSVKR